MSNAEQAALPYVELFTDGACSGNPGPGGWAFVLRHPASGKEIERSGGDAYTTNNKMELMSVIEGLSVLKKRSRVLLQSDSQYVLKGMKEWVPNWKRNGWRRKEGTSWKPVANDDLWKRLDELASGHDIETKWIRGHNGHAENERCDQLAVQAADAAKRRS